MLKVPYQNAEGALNHCTIITCPDISLAVQKVAQLLNAFYVTSQALETLSSLLAESSTLRSFSHIVILTS